jgi:hypothetical protein
VSAIRSGQIVLFYLFDIADTIELSAVSGLIGGPTVEARFAPKQVTPAYVQYEKPPLSFDGDAVGVTDVDGFHPRIRLYDYGIVSVALSRPFSGEWSDLVSPVCVPSGPAAGPMYGERLSCHVPRLRGRIHQRFCGSGGSVP